MLCRGNLNLKLFTSWTIRMRDPSNHLKHLSSSVARPYAVKVQLDNDLEKKLTCEEMKPRKHSGINKQMAARIPDRIQSAILKAIGDYSMKSLVESGEELNRYIKCRKVPMEEANIRLKKKEIEELVLSEPEKFKLPKFPHENDEAGLKNFMARKNQKVQQIVKQRVYGWKPINYDEYKSLSYLIGRSAMEYAVIMRLFQEITKRDPNFAPKSYFDFGSGVGTGVWAAAELWKSSIFEYYLVDSSKHMNDLSDLILRDGDANKAMFLRNVNYRQFVPSREDKFDLVMSAFSFFELPSLKNRLEIAQNLWNKAEQYLIFVEVGTNAAFNMLNEIRDFLLEVKNVNKEDAFIFSPCPHDKTCPRYELNDGTPCNFEVAYNTPKYSGSSMYVKDNYSYLIIKKGKSTEESDKWPRLVRSPLLRHKHTICRMCTQDGSIKEGIFTAAKHGKLTYKCAKVSKWGDQLPLQLLDSEIIESEES